MKTSDDDFEQLRVLEESLWKAETRFDRAYTESVFAQDFFEYGRSGRFHSRDACLGMNAEPIDAVIPLPNFDVRMISRDVAQVTYTSLVTYDGVVQRGRRSSIWSRTDGSWKIRFHQGTVHDDVIEPD